jgi:hypothetical protein
LIANAAAAEEHEMILNIFASISLEKNAPFHFDIIWRQYFAICGRFYDLTAWAVHTRHG